jgi:ribosomal protein L7/L12
MELHGEIDPDIAELAASGRKIEAIRLYRERYGVGLEEAKDAVDGLPAAHSCVPDRLPPSATAALADAGLLTEIESLLRAGQMIRAIKLLRERSGAGLRESKDAVAALAEQIGIAPQRDCFIATAAYGSDAVPEVQLLRRFRDRTLCRSVPGRAFVRAYYHWSPALAAWLTPRPPTCTLLRALLGPAVALCRCVEERRSRRRSPESTEPARPHEPCGGSG